MCGCAGDIDGKRTRHSARGLNASHKVAKV
jgi:hypothetical protein